MESRTHRSSWRCENQGLWGTISPSRRGQLIYSESVNVRHAKAWSHDVRSCLIVAKGRFLKRAAEFGRLQVTVRLLLPVPEGRVTRPAALAFVRSRVRFPSCR